MQRWLRIHEYANDYLSWVYKYYASHGVAYLCTYYNLDLANSIYDGSILDGGSYDPTGSEGLTGLKWRKILFLPVYNIEQIQPVFTADESGVTKKDQTSMFNFPTTYGIQPMPRDFVKFEQNVLKPENNTYPLYKVVNFEKATNTDISRWKVSLKVTYQRERNLEDQISGTYVFFDYTKRIYPIEISEFLFRLLDKNENFSILDNFYKKESSFYVF